MSLPTEHRILKDRRTKNLTGRLRPGDIAVIHHSDLDSTAARALVDRRVAAVVNAVQSISGRYPNRGPGVLLDAGIPLLDACGEAEFDRVADGSKALFDGESVRFENGLCLAGTLMTSSMLEELLAAAHKNLGVELDHFARNTLEYLDTERGMLFDTVDLPALKTRFAGRHALIVVRGEGYKDDLAMLSDYLLDARPALIAVDGGADALLEAKLRPHVILGDMDSVSDAALHCGAELVVHGYGKDDSRGAPGLARIEKLGLHAAVLHAPGTSEDIAMLMADELGATLIVAVGTHFSLEEFLDKGRRGMASTFLTRLRIGSKLVDAKGIARLWQGQRTRYLEICLILFAAATPIVAVVMLSQAGQILVQTLNVWLRAHFHI